MGSPSQSAPHSDTATHTHAYTMTSRFPKSLGEFSLYFEAHTFFGPPPPLSCRPPSWLPWSHSHQQYYGLKLSPTPHTPSTPRQLLANAQTLLVGVFAWILESLLRDKTSGMGGSSCISGPESSSLSSPWDWAAPPTGEAGYIPPPSRRQV